MVGRLIAQPRNHECFVRCDCRHSLCSPICTTMLDWRKDLAMEETLQTIGEKLVKFDWKLDAFAKTVDAKLDAFGETVDAKLYELYAFGEKFDAKLHAFGETFDEKLNAGFTGVAQHFAKIDERFEAVDKRFDVVDRPP